MNNFHNYIFAILLIIISCNNIDNSLNSFFDDLEHKIDKETIQKFKDAPRQAVIIYSANFTEEFTELHNSPEFRPIVDDFLNQIENSYDRTTAEESLIIAFQTRLNNQEINIKKIANEVYQYNREFDKNENIEQ